MMPPRPKPWRKSKTPLTIEIHASQRGKIPLSDDKQPRRDQEDAPEDVSHAVERERKQIKRVRQALIVQGGICRDLPSEQTVDSDVADRMEGDHQRAADQHQGVEGTQRPGNAAQQVV